ncbi:MAG: KamA family radical SAM protein [Deltaproteobacteria bacterium]|nr:KamA family radical SAM protein [Deltaproteobacteria bacterium]
MHRQFLEGGFWRKIPAYSEVDEKTFLDSHWQSRHAVTNVEKLRETIGKLIGEPVYADIAEGLHHVPMSVRMTPYLISLIDWKDPYGDPLCRQFLPFNSVLMPDHPKLRLDSLSEVKDSPVPGLTHRYPDKVLFLTLDKCPVYCRFCTRSYAVGLDTEEVEKIHVSGTFERWKVVFDYLRAHEKIEDVVVSGGDTYNLRPDQVTLIGNTLLDIPHIRRMRFATKGLAIMPMKILTDREWYDAFLGVVTRGKKMHKDVVLHTHFNHPNEMTGITKRAMDQLFEDGVVVRNQSVLLRQINDDVETMKLLIKKLGYLNIHPYYVYQHDMVKGVEDLRTTVATAVELEKEVRGATAGYNTPTFVVDAPGGGGKREVHSYEYYNRTTGISVYRSPNINPNQLYLYFDPIHLLPKEGQARWANPSEHEKMVEEALQIKPFGV